MLQNSNPRLSRRKLYPVLGLALVAAVVAVAGVAGVAGMASGAASKTVTLKNVAFAPKTLSISKGTRVIFAFRDDGTTHNVTSTAGRRFTTIRDRKTGSPSRTFSRAGTYRYECTLHPGMTGRITVR